MFSPVSVCVTAQASVRPLAARQTRAFPAPAATMLVASTGLSAAAFAAASTAAGCQPATATGVALLIDRQDGVSPAGNATSPVTPAVVMVPRPDAGSSAARTLPDPARAKAGAGKLPSTTPAAVSTVPLDAST